MIYLSFEKRLTDSFWTRTGITVLSILLAFGVGGIFLALAGVNPFGAYRAVFNEVLFTRYGWEDLALKISPLLLTGIAVALAANLRTWNIGADGQLYMGALGATWVALHYGDRLSSITIIPLMLMAAMVCGALWAGVPAVLKARFGVNEIITTLLLNYVALSWVDYLIFGSWRDPHSLNFPITQTFAESVQLPVFGDTPIHIGLLFGPAIILLTYFILTRTSLGIRIVISGDNPDAARYSGIHVKRLIILVMMASGAIAGLAGMTEVTGVHHRLQQNISLGYGYTGIIIAWLARNRPLGVLAYTLFMAIIFVGGELLQIDAGLPKAMIDLFQGIVLFSVLGLGIFSEYRLKVTRIDQNESLQQNKA